MGIHELLKRQAEKISEKNSEPEYRSEPVEVHVPREVDAKTCERIGNLAAYGLGDKEIAEALMLSSEQIKFARSTVEFHQAFSSQLAEQQQRAIDLDEGWDAVQEKSLAIVLESLRGQRDPKFALNAAFIANKAIRRTPRANARLIDASKAGATITIKMNRTYVQNNQTINVQPPRDLATIPRRQSDILTPQRVTQILGVQSKDEEIDRLSAMLDDNLNGVVPELIEGDE